MHFQKYHDFRDILKSSEAQAKMVKCILFYLNMVDNTQGNSISPFSEDTYFTTAAYFRFQCERFKHQFDGIFFYNFQSRMITSGGNE